MIKFVSLLCALFFMIVIIIYDKYTTRRELAKIKQQQDAETDRQHNM
ncbi:hypothetical protein JXQ31_20195 [candidate division KSB1 bacterium]|nr:hypothetical protein [candidate division KSB1 bacterium]